MTKRHVYLPSRTVVVEDGTVRDLDGNTLGEVKLVAACSHRWRYRAGEGVWSGLHLTQAEALAGLLADPSTPPGGPNRFDRPR